MAVSVSIIPTLHVSLLRLCVSISTAPPPFQPHANGSLFLGSPKFLLAMRELTIDVGTFTFGEGTTEACLPKVWQGLELRLVVREGTFTTVLALAVEMEFTQLGLLHLQPQVRSCVSIAILAVNGLTFSDLVLSAVGRCSAPRTASTRLTIGPL